MLHDRRVRPCVEQLEDRCVPATITVTNLNDGTGVPGMTLREAVEKANLTTASDTIVFKAGLKGTLTLTDGQIDIASGMKIKGPGASKITIQAGLNSRIFEHNDNQAGQASVSIRKLSLRGGNVNFGGVIRGFEDLTIADARLYDNIGTQGGGIVLQSNGNLTLLNTTVHGNRTTISGNGGAVRFDSSDNLTVTNCSFFDNRTIADGGALSIENAASATISNSTFADNRAAGSGGAIYWIGPGALTLSNCSLIGNASTAGGGGLFIDGGSHEILKSTIAYNSAEGSGGGVQVSNGADLTLRNSTISSNRAAINGGGLSIASGNTSLLNCTVAYNLADGNGGGVHSAAPLVFAISTIVARNAALGNGNDLSSASLADDIFLIDHCLIEDDNAAFANLDDNGGNVLGENPLLGPLQNNGGPTLTHALQSGSPALNVGASPAGNSTTDQRGGKFKRVKGGGIDIGAFER